MGTGYLIDTNVLIYFLGNALPQKGQSFVQSAIDESFCISAITKMETLSKIAPDFEDMKRLIDLADILMIDHDVINQTIALRQTLSIKLPDAIIAATALVHRHTLLSRNTRDFANISALTVIDPFALV